jgi:hypothetical protein
MNSEDESNVDLICRQTDYTREEALEKLTVLKDPIKVIKSYVVPRETPKAALNTHQMIYHQIGKFVEETSQQRLRKN